MSYPKDPPCQLSLWEEKRAPLQESLEPRSRRWKALALTTARSKRPPPPHMQWCKGYFLKNIVTTFSWFAVLCSDTGLVLLYFSSTSEGTGTSAHTRWCKGHFLEFRFCKVKVGCRRNKKLCTNKMFNIIYSVLIPLSCLTHGSHFIISDHIIQFTRLRFSEISFCYLSNVVFNFVSHILFLCGTLSIWFWLAFFASLAFHHVFPNLAGLQLASSPGHALSSTLSLLKFQWVLMRILARLTQLLLSFDTVWQGHESWDETLQTLMQTLACELSSTVIRGQKV